MKTFETVHRSGWIPASTIVSDLTHLPHTVAIAIALLSSWLVVFTTTSARTLLAIPSRGTAEYTLARET